MSDHSREHERIQVVDPPHSSSDGTLLRVEGLKKYFSIRKGFFSRIVGHVKAVDGVSFEIRRGETLGLVGESGCGKTTLARVILRLIDATEGEVSFEEIPVFSLNNRELRKLRRRMQIIFQDPFGSLNPRLTVGSMISEAIKIHKLAKGGGIRDRVVELLDRVGIPAEHMNRYPHEFSGGQRQRIGIARALAVSPDLVIADEPVSALDVSIQAQIINLLKDLQNDLGLTYLFIAHDLGVVEYISDRVAVMYLGKIVEITDSGRLYSGAMHPYSEALLSAIPSLDPAKKSERIILQGDVPSPAQVPPGCPFHTRCPHAKPICQQEEPVLKEISRGHQVSCWLYET
ncbi:MAG: ATP-binding cassette domain-containing protein [Candidatus Latescibacteria bacterium]|nr:ATP-binding cassette domain-containing protein [Candidatus Latescibacterota bacterium]NIO27308.1 ATP-binding cassette domain-containing protein [Candidatus Latescibacterota bacterium]NIO54832.1 ATP-binding cassette domain-containing protein [Candidatus Latescibacterota bacterium]NIT00915.1 ATP-binding cassette domain-containing protein [Candidatus Latescibacterota bacterium]NIT37838.1 ATP-binding cassette domain-containing protein [Candidatus Latescibacterota bacterium]